MTVFLSRRCPESVSVSDINRPLAITIHVFEPLHLNSCSVKNGSSFYRDSSYLLDAVKRKTLVLDLDETLIHSHHDGVIRQPINPRTPPDFVLKVGLVRFACIYCASRIVEMQARESHSALPSGDDRSTSGSLLRAQAASRGLLPGNGQSVVRPGRLHGQHGDLRRGSG